MSYSIVYLEQNGVDDPHKPSCDFRKLQNGFWRAFGGIMKGWRDQPDLVNYAYTHMALTLQSMIAAQQPPQRHMAREETRKALLFILRKQAAIKHGTELIDAYAHTSSTPKWTTKGRSESTQPWDTARVTTRK